MKHNNYASLSSADKQDVYNFTEVLDAKKQSRLHTTKFFCAHRHSGDEHMQ